MKPAHLRKLRKAYKEKKLIPFIGAGLSAPFGIPTWGQLIIEIANNYLDSKLIEIVKRYIERKDYWKAIEILKDFGDVNEFDIQEEICELIKNKVIKMVEEVPIEKHNYCDLADFKVLNYITTNYDFLLSDFCHFKSSIPQVLYKIGVNSQSFFSEHDEASIWHIHGHVGDTSSIIVSETKYKELYSESKYLNLFKLLQGTGVFLFLGFSFDDHYIQKIMRENNIHFNSKHYIVLDNPSEEQKNILINEFGLNVIEYDSMDDTKHAEKIREILNEIKESSKDNIDISNMDLKDEDETTVLTNEKREDMDKSLFCEKIKLENIARETLDYSKDCFFLIEKQIRKLRNKGFSEKEINYILSIVYMKYSYIKNTIYRHTKNSQVFLDKVHEELSKMKIDKLDNFCMEQELISYGKQGAIHVVANDINQNVWWGEKRLNGI